VTTSTADIPVVILCGGMGTRLREASERLPKPMVDIGGRPILWHIMQRYAHHGFKEFGLALGYKGGMIKRYFLDYYELNGNLWLDLGTGRVVLESQVKEDWKIHFQDTGLQTLTGGRLRHLAPWLGDAPFMLTYGDGVADVDVRRLVAFHQAHGKLATITAVRPPSRFGGLELDGDAVASFTEKPQIGEGWINGGFMVFEPGIFEHLEGDHTRLEQDVLEPLAAAGQLAAYRHEGFWQCMDTLRDKLLLESLWQSGTAPWRVEE
jgi:glucose-1-phosphate cytidylyltransferase